MTSNESRCTACNGNDGDAPCAYPSEGRAGCLRESRMAFEAWAKSIGLMKVIFGILGINSQTDIAQKAWQASEARMQARIAEQEKSPSYRKETHRSLFRIAHLEEENDQLRQERDKLRDLCGAAYQLAGCVGASTVWLDALGDAAAGEIGARFKGEYLDLLPVVFDAGQQLESARAVVPFGYTYPAALQQQQERKDGWAGRPDGFFAHFESQGNYTVPLYAAPQPDGRATPRAEQPEPAAQDVNAEPPTRELAIGIPPHVNMWRITFLPDDKAEAVLIGPATQRAEAITKHDSDCATHNEPAYPNGPCDCGLAGMPLQNDRWYWIEYEGLGKTYTAPAMYKANVDCFYSYEFSGIPTRQVTVLREAAAPSAPAPNSVAKRKQIQLEGDGFEPYAATVFRKGDRYGILGALGDVRFAGAPADVMADAERLDFLDLPGIEYGIDVDPEAEGHIVIYRVSGNRNDREWKEIGRGSTVRAAIDDARAAEKGAAT